MDSLAILRTSILASLGLASACSRRDQPKPDPATPIASASEDVPVAKPYVEPPKKKTGPSSAYAETLGLSLGEDGHLRRSAKVQCASTPGTCPAGATGDCKTDADCKAHPHGFCRKYELDPSAPAQCGCDYACASDADCKKDEACLCNDPTWGHASCVQAKCRSDADCPSGKCELAEWYNGCGTTRMFACRTSSDKCQTGDDCAGGPNASGCGWSETKSSWECMTRSCIAGRPLVIEGEETTAPTILRDDWMHAQPNAGEIGRWTEIARLEHASIASFAVFTLELLQLGAPADLLRDTQLAALDEIEHARLAFGRASTGAPIGPAKLDLSGLRVRTDPSDIARTLVEEGCIGETIGSAEAAREADDEVFARIADDERRHAELAWRTLKWLLETHPEAAPAARTAFSTARAHDPFRRAVLEEVIRPCAAALLG
ncbi:MAG: ferritin-like domain-containing protein [Polyangiales bacterium]